jgi:hypothetical protein
MNISEALEIAGEGARLEGVIGGGHPIQIQVLDGGGNVVGVFSSNGQPLGQSPLQNLDTTNRSPFC